MLPNFLVSINCNPLACFSLIYCFLYTAAASPPAVVDPARHVDAGAAGGGSRVELAAAAAAFQPGSMKFLLNLVRRPCRGF